MVWRGPSFGSNGEAGGCGGEERPGWPNVNTASATRASGSQTQPLPLQGGRVDGATAQAGTLGVEPRPQRPLKSTMDLAMPCRFSSQWQRRRTQSCRLSVFVFVCLSACLLVLVACLLVCVCLCCYPCCCLCCGGMVCGGCVFTVYGVTPFICCAVRGSMGENSYLEV